MFTFSPLLHSTELRGSRPLSKLTLPGYKSRCERMSSILDALQPGLIIIYTANRVRCNSPAMYIAIANVFVMFFGDFSINSLLPWYFYQLIINSFVGPRIKKFSRIYWENCLWKINNLWILERTQEMFVLHIIALVDVCYSRKCAVLSNIAKRIV